MSISPDLSFFSFLCFLRAARWGALANAQGGWEWNPRGLVDDIFQLWQQCLANLHLFLRLHFKSRILIWSNAWKSLMQIHTSRVGYIVRKKYKFIYFFILGNSQYILDVSENGSHLGIYITVLFNTEASIWRQIFLMRKVVRRTFWKMNGLWFDRCGREIHRVVEINSDNKEKD